MKSEIEILFSADSSDDTPGTEEEKDTKKIHTSNSPSAKSQVVSSATVTQLSNVPEYGYDAGDENSRVTKVSFTVDSNFSKIALPSQDTTRSVNSPLEREPMNHFYTSFSATPTPSDRSPSPRRRSPKHSPKASLSLIQTKPDLTIRRWQTGSKDDGDHSLDRHSPYLDYYSSNIFPRHHLRSPRSPSHLDSHYDQLHDTIPQKRYESWKGNNTFFFGGRVMTGSHPYQLLLSVVLIFFTSLSFIVLIAPFYQAAYWYNIFLFFNFCTFAFLINTSFTEPGIYPKRHVNPSNHVDIFQTKYYHILKSQYCLTCSIIHSERSKHCKYCNNCVELFDHHCPWTGNCIGLRNYTSFFCFITFLFVSLSYMILLLLPIIVYLGFELYQDPYVIATLLHILLVLFYFLWIGMIYIFVGALFFLHIYLCFMRQTTNEYFRQRRLKQRQALGLPTHVDQSPASSMTPSPQEKESGCFEVFFNACGGLVFSIFQLTPLIFQKFSLNLQSTVTNNTHPSSATTLNNGRNTKEPLASEDISGLKNAKSKYYRSQIISQEDEQGIEEKEDGSERYQFMRDCVKFCLPCSNSKHYEVLGNSKQFSHHRTIPLHTRLLPFWQYESAEDDEQQDILLEILYNQLQHELFHSSDI